MSEVEKEMVESTAGIELFSFRPRLTTDKNRIAEILAPVYVSSTATELSELHNEDDARFTALGKAVAIKLAVKATEYPFVRIFHSYKYQERSIDECFYNSKTAECAPAADPESAREKYSDVWDDKQFNALCNNEHGERASTCKVIKCPKCQGTGKEYYDDYDTEERWETCPNCGGSGEEGVWICKYCEGKGKVLTKVKVKQRCQKTCESCGGEGKGLSALRVSSRGNNIEKKWECVLEHEPKLHSQKELEFDYSYLKTDASKKAAQIKKIRTINVEGGVIDPKKHNLSKLSLEKEDIKRVYNACYPQLGSNISAFFLMQNQKPKSIKWDKDGYRRTIISDVKYFDEKITIVTGIGWVKIDLANGESFWVNTLRRSAEIPLMASGGGRRWTPLFAIDINDVKKCRMKDYEPCVQEAIKEAKREGVATPKLKKNSSDLKKTKDAIQGCGRLLAIIAAVAFGIWWWIEGFSMAAITDLWKSANKGGLSDTAAMVLGGLAIIFVGWKLLKRGGLGKSTSPKKRWKFVTLGILLGCIGAHLAYAKRWFLFLLLWAGLIVGNVMSGDSNEQIVNLEKQEEAQTVEQAELSYSQQNTDAGKEQSTPIGNIGFAVWVLLWIGGTLFIKKDGNGCRM